MPTRFDHAVIAVRDLDRAIDDFTRLGFEVRRGGFQPGLGAVNAAIPFGLDYIELLSVVGQGTVAAAQPVVQVLLEMLEKREGFAGYCLASGDIERQAARLRDAGLPAQVLQVTPEQSGREFGWTLIFPGGMPWLRPWPFLIEYVRSEEESRRPARHRNGAQRCVGARVGMKGTDPQRLLVEQLGLAAGEDGFWVGDFLIRPETGSEALGLLELEIAVGDLDETRRELPAGAIAGIAGDRISLQPGATAGAQIVLVSARST